MPQTLSPARWSLPPLWIVAVFLGLQLVFGYYGFMLWTLAQGVLFTAYWMRPRREWWCFALAAIGANVAVAIAVAWHSSGNPAQYFQHFSWAQFIIGSVLQAFIAMAGVHFLMKRGIRADTLGNLAQIGSLHLAALITAGLYALKDLLLVLAHGHITDVQQGQTLASLPLKFPEAYPLLASFALSHAMGAFLGILLLVPLALWLLVPGNRPGSQRIIRSALIYLYLLPMLLYLGNSLLIDPNGSVAAMLKILLLAGVVIFSFLHGWRGAALSVAVVSVLMALDNHIRGGGADILEMQLYVSVMGALALLFGASVDELRRSRSLLKIDRDQLQQALAKLATSSRRSLSSEELERKRLARELHDEMGQTLTAMQAQLSLSHQRASNEEQSNGIQLLEQLTQRLGRSLRSVVNALTPDELDQLGLYAAITYGSPSQMCEYAGVNYTCEIYGDSQLLDRLEMVTNLAAYRIVQEAVNNALKYANCQNIRVRMRIGERQRKILVLLDILDDGIGLKSLGQIEHGFYSIRDRAAALNGVLHIQNIFGVRIHVLLRQ